MDDAALVRVGQGPGDLPRKMQHLAPLQGTAPIHILSQCDTVYKLHDYVFDIIAVADVVNGHNIRMGQHGDGVCLRAEGAPEFLVRGHLVPHDLDGDAAVETLILRLIHNRHAALADQLPDQVAIVQDHA